MPLFRVRRERCIPHDVVVEAPTMYDAEQAADADADKWSEGCAYWQEIETEELEDGDDDPVIVVPAPAPVVSVPVPESVWGTPPHVLEETPWFNLEDIKARRFGGSES